MHSLLSWLQHLGSLPKEVIVMIIGALPVLEVRWAIPQALIWKMSFVKAFWLSVIGNSIPVVPALFLFEPVSNTLRKFKIWAKFFDWLEERTRKRADAIQKYEALGLAIFVAIPLPGTGAWSGCFAATLFKIKFRYAVVAIIAGVIGAALIVSGLCALGIISWQAIIQ